MNCVKLALVKYLKDEVREIVPVEDVKNFLPVDLDNFEKRRTYKVLWPRVDKIIEGEERTYYEANILRLAEKEDDFYKGKRISAVPRSLVYSASDSETCSDNTPTNWKKIEKSELSSKVRDRVNLKRRLSFSAEFDNEMSEEVGVSFFTDKLSKRISEVEMELKKRNEESAEKQIVYENIIADLEDQLRKVTIEEANNETDIYLLREKLKILEENLDGKERRLNQLIDLNIQLQKKVLSNFEGDELQSNPILVPVVNGKEHDAQFKIGEDLFISQRGWSRINSHASPSLIVKDLTGLLWNENVLKEKSVTGRKCPTLQGDPKPPLTPQKVAAVNNTLCNILMERKVDATNLERERKSVNRYLREKINDVQRKYKKNCTSLPLPQEMDETNPEESSQGINEENAPQQDM